MLIFFLTCLNSITLIFRISTFQKNVFLKFFSENFGDLLFLNSRKTASSGAFQCFSTLSTRAFSAKKSKMNIFSALHKLSTSLC